LQVTFALRAARFLEPALESCSLPLDGGGDEVTPSVWGTVAAAVL